MQKLVAIGRILDVLQPLLTNTVACIALIQKYHIASNLHSVLDMPMLYSRLNELETLIVPTTVRIFILYYRSVT